MKNSAPQAVKLSEYKAPEFLVSEIELKFDLHEDHANVDSRLQMKNSAGAQALSLDGEKLELRYVNLAGKTLGPGDYEVTDTQLTIKHAPKGEFTLEIGTKIKPQENLPG